MEEGGKPRGGAGDLGWAEACPLPGAWLRRGNKRAGRCVRRLYNWGYTIARLAGIGLDNRTGWDITERGSTGRDGGETRLCVRGLDAARSDGVLLLWGGFADRMSWALSAAGAGRDGRWNVRGMRM